MKFRNEDNVVKIVQGSWRKLAAELSGHPVYLKKLKSSSKTWANCVKIIDFCYERAVNPEQYIFVINSLYDKTWLNYTFKNDYAPFNIIVSEKNLDRAHELFYAEVDKKRDIQSEVEQYKTLLKDTPSDIAEELIQCGFCGSDMDLKNALYKVIRCRT